MPKTTRHGGPTPPPIVTYPKGKDAEQVVAYPDAEPVAVDEDTHEQDTDDVYDGLTVAELQAELRDRGLPTSGNKAELVERLLDDDTAPE